MSPHYLLSHRRFCCIQDLRVYQGVYEYKMQNKAFWRGWILIYICSRNNMNVNGSFNAGFVQYTLWTWNKCSVYFCKTEIVISIWQHFRSEERQTFKNVQNQFIFKNSLLTKYFWYKLVQSFVKSRFLVLNSVRFEWMKINTAALKTIQHFGDMLNCNTSIHCGGHYNVTFWIAAFSLVMQT